MSEDYAKGEFYISSSDFDEGEEIPKKCGYKFENSKPIILFWHKPEGTKTLALIMDDPDAMKAVGKVWVHWLVCNIPSLYVSELPSQLPKSTEEMKSVIEHNNDESLSDISIERWMIIGKTDFGETKYGGPAPPDGRHTYIFKAYALDSVLDLNDGYSKQELEDAMKGHIISEARLTGTFAP